MTSEEYLKDRVQDQIDWYEQNSSRSKANFFRIQITIALSSVSIPLLSIFHNQSYVPIFIAILGSLTAFLTALASLFQFREHWIEYRTTSELLKHEKFIFLTQSGPYSDKNGFSAFVARVEKIVSRQHSSWQERQEDFQSPLSATSPIQQPGGVLTNNVTNPTQLNNSQKELASIRHSTNPVSMEFETHPKPLMRNTAPPKPKESEPL